jgi:hypothetical protein
MKKSIYISLFIVLGILISFLIHGLVEIWYIGFLLNDFPKYSLGFSWAQWFLIHNIGTAVLLAAGILFGFWQGKHWWRRIYEKRQNK